MDAVMLLFLMAPAWRVVHAGAGAAAESQPSQANAAREDPAPSESLSVTVTGQGRSQQLQTVPIAVQVLTGADLRERAVNNLGDVWVPGLTVDASKPTQPAFTMRGVGNYDFGIGTDSPVGIYVNGIYTGKGGGALLNFNDIRRVEVLRGPQGTLFGRNSAGGAVAIITNDPTGAQETRGLVRLGNHGTRHVEVLANQPLNDDIAMRLSTVSQYSAGWVRDAGRGNLSGGENAWSGRLSMRWSASGSTSALLAWEHEELNQRTRPVWSLAVMTPTFDKDPSAFVDPRTQPLRNDNPTDRERRNFNGLSLRIEHSLPWAEFTSTTAWRHYKTSKVEDNDGTADVATHLSTANFDANTSVQQEFRLSGQTASLDWLAGTSLFQERARQTSRLDSYSDTLDTLLKGIYGIRPFATLNAIAQLAGAGNVDLRVQSWQEGMNNTGDYRAMAMYGDVIWRIAPETRLTTGARYTHDRKRFTWNSPLRSAPGLDAQLQVFPPLLAGLQQAGVLDAVAAGQLTAMAQGLASSNIEFTDADANAGMVSLSKSWNDFSPRLVVDHKLSTHTMVYASVTRGYQAGGFNAVSTNRAIASFEPETVTSDEVGAKGVLPQAGVSYAASLFHYKFRNVQAITLDHSTAVPVYTIAVSDQKATGLDLEGSWQVGGGLRLFGAAELIDHNYARFVTSDRQLDLSGQPVFTPRVVATLGLHYKWAVANGVADFMLQTAHTGPSRCNDDSQNQGTCLRASTFTVGEAQDQIDSRIGWEAASKKWGVALVVNNLSDKRYIKWTSNFASVAGVPYYAALTRPRSVAVEIHASM
jgi:iron complex outermembrane receptor protein